MELYWLGNQPCNKVYAPQDSVLKAGHQDAGGAIHSASITTAIAPQRHFHEGIDRSVEGMAVMGGAGEQLSGF